MKKFKLVKLELEQNKYLLLAFSFLLVFFLGLIIASFYFSFYIEQSFLQDTKDDTYHITLNDVEFNDFEAFKDFNVVSEIQEPKGQFLVGEDLVQNGFIITYFNEEFLSKKTLVSIEKQDSYSMCISKSLSEYLDIKKGESIVYQAIDGQCIDVLVAGIIDSQDIEVYLNENFFPLEGPNSISVYFKSNQLSSIYSRFSEYDSTVVMDTQGIMTVYEYINISKVVATIFFVLFFFMTIFVLMNFIFLIIRKSAKRINMLRTLGYTVMDVLEIYYVIFIFVLIFATLLGTLFSILLCQRILFLFGMPIEAYSFSTISLCTLIIGVLFIIISWIVFVIKFKDYKTINMTIIKGDE